MASHRFQDLSSFFAAKKHIFLAINGLPFPTASPPVWFGALCDPKRVTACEVSQGGFALGAACAIATREAAAKHDLSVLAEEPRWGDLMGWGLVDLLGFVGIWFVEGFNPSHMDRGQKENLRDHRFSSISPFTNRVFKVFDPHPYQPIVFYQTLLKKRLEDIGNDAFLETRSLSADFGPCPSDFFQPHIET